MVGGISLARARGLLLDWDGCVAIGDRLLPDAIRLIDACRDRLVILSNNSTHLPDDMATMLQREGIAIGPERILLAGAEAVAWAGRLSAGRVMLLGSPRMTGFARTQGLQLVEDRPDMVLLMRDTDFTYAKLDRAVAALAAGARLVVANGDRTHPGAEGRPVPETGALLAAIMACLPDIEPLILGKPGPMLFERACRILGIRAEEGVMIGDNAETDGAGAAAFGMPCILVGGGTGVAIGDLLTGARSLRSA
ncbi:MAG: HAD hydrolase-like protein [Pseudomonadota bacterium]